MSKRVWLKKVDRYLHKVCIGDSNSWVETKPMCKKDAQEIMKMYKQLEKKENK